MEIKSIAYTYKKKIAFINKKELLLHIRSIAFTYKKNCFPARDEKAIFLFP